MLTRILVGSIGFLFPGIGLFFLGNYKKGLSYAALLLIAILIVSWAGALFIEKSVYVLFVLYIVYAFSSFVHYFLSPKLKRPIKKHLLLCITFAAFYSGVFITLALFKPLLLGWQVYQIPSPSMYPELKVGDIVIADTRPWVTNEVQKGDIVVFYPPDSNSIYYIKRIVASGGDTVEIVDGELFVNGQSKRTGLKTKKMTTRTIEENHFFMMGDNANQSRDSRFWGDVSRKDIVGKFSYVIYRRE